MISHRTLFLMLVLSSLGCFARHKVDKLCIGWHCYFDVDLEKGTIETNLDQN